MMRRHHCFMYNFCLIKDLYNDSNVRSVLTTMYESGIHEWSAKLYVRRTQPKPRYLLIFKTWNSDLAINVKLVHGDELVQQGDDIIADFEPLKQLDIDELIKNNPNYYQPNDSARYTVMHSCLQDIIP